MKNLHAAWPLATRPDFFFYDPVIKVDLLLYDGKSTDIPDRNPRISLAGQESK